MARLAAASGDATSLEAFSAASIAAAARAIDLGLQDAANAILASASLDPPRIHHYESFWAVDRSADIAVLAVGVAAALRRRPVALMDIAPAGCRRLCRLARARARPAAFRKELKQKLAEPAYDGKKHGRRRQSSDARQRSDYSRAVTHRIEPLISYAQAVSEIVRPPQGRRRSEVAQWSRSKISRATSSKPRIIPIAMLKPMSRRTGFRAIFAVADAVGAIDRVIADRIAEWVTTAPGLSVPQLTEVAARLSRMQPCHDAALKLASHVEKQILLDTDVASRVSAYGLLARAVWRVGIDGPPPIFVERSTWPKRSARTISTAPIICWSSLVIMRAMNFRGSGTNLARILELNQSEDGKFPWIEYAKTMVPIAGLTTLATLARLDDRDKARLGLSLGPALTVLVQADKLPVELAAAVFGLAAPIEAWNLAHSPTLPPSLSSVSRPSGGSGSWARCSLKSIETTSCRRLRTTIEALQRLAVAHLPVGAPARARIDALAARRGPEQAGAVPLNRSEAQILYEVDLADPDDIDRAVLREEIGRSGRRWPALTLGELAARAATPAQRLDFVRAVVDFECR